MTDMTTKLLEGERALVTGCAGGIGRGIARALKDEGATVLGSDIVAPPAEDGIDFFAADLSKHDGWKGLLDGALKKLGTISLFVHAASPRRLEVDTPLAVSETTWDAMTGVNLRSGFFLAREAGRHMRDNGIKGRILLITSQHREMPRNLAHYSASKAGMTMVMKELARVLAPDGIRVNSIARRHPGRRFRRRQPRRAGGADPARPCRHAGRHCPGRRRGLVGKIWPLRRGNDGRSRWRPGSDQLDSFQGLTGPRGRSIYTLESRVLSRGGFTMTLRINSTAPDFKAETTQGPIEFHKWIGDGWAILFSHPKDFTPVCTTELGYMAGLKPEFDKRNTKIVGLSVDPVSNHAKWSKDIEETQGHAVTYPMIGDPELKVATAYDMLPEGAGSTSEGRTAADNATVRSVFVIGPDKKIKAMLTYPMSTGRNFDEVLRLLESCQLTAKHQVATPVNWKKGEDVIIVPAVSDEAAKAKYPNGWKAPKPYLRIVPQPRD
jgi:alkyl hydroperoxide reductase subunit AhpC/NAD(P)-dependent dehydrogenase (short-subunit alcohol dehydrogenase family)